MYKTLENGDKNRLLKINLVLLEVLVILGRPFLYPSPGTFLSVLG